MKSVVDKVLTFTQQEAEAFLADINGSTCTSNYLCGNIGSINVDIVNAWKTLVDNANTNTKRTLFGQDFPLLTEIVNVRTNYTAAFNHGTMGNLENFIKTYQNRVPCKTCIKNGTKLANTDFDDFDELIKNTRWGYQNSFVAPTVAGYPGFYEREPFALNNQNARSGGQHMLKYLKENGLGRTAIAAVDEAFGGTNPYASKRCDVRLITPNASNIVFIEFKSIKRKSNKSVEPDLTQKDDTESVENPTDNNPPINPQIEPISAGVDASGIDVEQLLGYLADPRTVSLSSLRYVLNAKKMDPNDQANATNLARKKMQLVFKGSKASDIFDIFWNRFKVDFFPTRPNTPQGKIDARSDFNTLVNNLDNKFFGFVTTN